jgi:hypothetical protein
MNRQSETTADKLSASAKLKAQNNGRSWLDCNDHGLNHRWQHVATLGVYREHGVNYGGRDYWRCSRCPVSTLTVVGVPPRKFLQEGQA